MTPKGARHILKKNSCWFFHLLTQASCDIFPSRVNILQLPTNIMYIPTYYSGANGYNLDASEYIPNADSSNLHPDTLHPLFGVLATTATQAACAARSAVGGTGCDAHAELVFGACSCCIIVRLMSHCAGKICCVIILLTCYVCIAGSTAYIYAAVLVVGHLGDGWIS